MVQVFGLVQLWFRLLIWFRCGSGVVLVIGVWVRFGAGLGQG